MKEEQKEKKKHTVLIEGPVTADFIATSIAKHSSKTDIGAHAIFLGQIRKDDHANQHVESIDYSAHTEMAEKTFHTIREAAFEKFPMVCMHIYHSLGTVKVGEISLFVFVSCKHREKSFAALQYIVDEIKAHVPIWKKENYEDGSHSWIGQGQPLSNKR
jgi:molybdopterin synthase catalytic subunit